VSGIWKLVTTNVANSASDNNTTRSNQSKKSNNTKDPMPQSVNNLNMMVKKLNLDHLDIENMDDSQLDALNNVIKIIKNKNTELRPHVDTFQCSVLKSWINDEKALNEIEKKINNKTRETSLKDLNAQVSTFIDEQKKLYIDIQSFNSNVFAVYNQLIVKMPKLGSIDAPCLTIRYMFEKFHEVCSDTTPTFKIDFIKKLIEELGYHESNFNYLLANVNAHERHVKNAKKIINEINLITASDSDKTQKYAEQKLTEYCNIHDLSNESTSMYAQYRTNIIDTLDNVIESYKSFDTLMCDYSTSQDIIFLDKTHDIIINFLKYFNDRYMIKRHDDTKHNLTNTLNGYERMGSSAAARIIVKHIAANSSRDDNLQMIAKFDRSNLKSTRTNPRNVVAASNSPGASNAPGGVSNTIATSSAPNTTNASNVANATAVPSTPGASNAPDGVSNTIATSSAPSASSVSNAANATAVPSAPGASNAPGSVSNTVATSSTPSASSVSNAANATAVPSAPDGVSNAVATNNQGKHRRYPNRTWVNPDILSANANDRHGSMKRIKRSTVDTTDTVNRPIVFNWSSSSTDTTNNSASHSTDTPKFIVNTKSKPNPGSGQRRRTVAVRKHTQQTK